MRISLQRFGAAVMGVLFVLLVGGASAHAADYEQTVSQWTSYEDVAKWLDDNFRFDKKRQKTIQNRLRSQGPDGLLIRNPATLFENKKGYCADSANFALDALARINPAYNPRWVFIDNAMGKPDHWVTGFTVDGKIYIMDYGTGDKWRAMMGVHGPYDSLEEYGAYLETLNMPKFKFGGIRWRFMPGQVD